MTAVTVWLTAPLRADTSIMGEPEIDALTMASFVIEHNPDFDPAIAEAFVSVGRRYGVRGDIALCQAILETGWFRFADGTAVTPDQHNYCGLGVVRRGVAGCSFDSIEEGVVAMMQHLYAYCSRDPLPEGERLLDPRFKLVNRGSATTWEGLSNRWAANPSYGKNILAIYRKMCGHNPAPGSGTPQQRTEIIEIVIPFEDDGATAPPDTVGETIIF